METNTVTGFKTTYTSDILYDITTFINGQGGAVYIGIDEDGSVMGIDNPEATAAAIAKDIAMYIQPDATKLVQIKTVQLGGKSIIVLMAAKGIDKPYTLSRICETQTTQADCCADFQTNHSTVPSLPYEEMPSSIQQLTFKSLENAFNEYDLTYNEAQFKAMKLINDSGSYTNLALLLSDQCQHNIKIVQYEGCDKTTISDSRIVKGSLLKQFVKACYTIEYIVGSSSDSDYPQDAIREAMLNCIVHRDYSFNGSTIVNIFDDHIEFISLGGLTDGITMDAINMGISQTRNANLAEVFYTMELSEGCGTGISRINKLYSDCTIKPVFEGVQGAFRVNLPNLNTSIDNSPVPSDGVKAQVFALAQEKGYIVRSDVEQLTGLKTTAAYNLIKELCNEKKLEACGIGKRTTYRCR